jgi:aspartate kinase
MSSPIKVAKFGGTSVATAAQLLKVKAIIEADPQRLLIVPSAPGKAHAKDTKVTDLLYLAHQLAANGQPIDPVWERIAARFQEVIDGLRLDLDLKPVLDQAKARIQEIGAAGGTADYAASRGEAIHGLVVAKLLGAVYIDAAEVIRFDRAGRLDPASYKSIKTQCAPHFAASRRVVIPGFYGLGIDGQVKTFSRGGSDVTGSVVANGVDAELYENWTDVSGVLMTDPRIVPEAKSIGEITYRELRELSYMGASVLHEEAVFPVREKGIPINIRNTNAPLDAGTLIIADRNPGAQVVVGIAGTKGFTGFAIEKAMMNNEVGIARRALDVFERLGISIEHMPSGIDTMSVVVSDKSLTNPDGTSRIDELIEDLQGALKPDRITVTPGIALIATVGLGMAHAIGTAAKLFTALATARVNIRLIDQGSSEQNIIVGVEEGDLGKAIRAIYDAFR